MRSRLNLKVGLIGLKSRSRGQILENHVYILEGTVLIQCLRMNLCQNVCHHEKRTNLKVGHVGSKTRSLGQISKQHVYRLEGIVLTNLHETLSE